MIDPMVNDTVEIVDFGESMFVNQVKTPLLGGGAFLLTTFNEAAICFLTFSLKFLSKRIVLLINMEGQKMRRGEVLAAGRYIYSNGPSRSESRMR